MSLRNDLNEKFFWFVIGGGFLAGLISQSFVCGVIVFFALLLVSMATDVLR